jgi:hypothetical protein
MTMAKSNFMKWALRLAGIFVAVIVLTLLLHEAGTNQYLLYGAIIAGAIVLSITVFEMVKYFKNKEGKKVQFFNNDMKSVVWDRHNKMHYFFVMEITAISVIPWWMGIAIMTVWEIGDGFKPWYYDYEPTGHKLLDWFRRECLYSNKFSFQDFFVWNIAGFAWGLMFRNLFILLIK